MRDAWRPRLIFLRVHQRRAIAVRHSPSIASQTSARTSVARRAGFRQTLERTHQIRADARRAERPRAQCKLTTSSLRNQDPGSWHNAAVEIRPDGPDSMTARARVLEIFVGAELSRVYVFKFVKHGDRDAKVMQLRNRNQSNQFRGSDEARPEQPTVQ